MLPLVLGLGPDGSQYDDATAGDRAVRAVRRDETGAVTAPAFGAGRERDWTLGRLRPVTDRIDYATLCDRCGSANLAKVKGCIVCLTCRYKHSCDGWG